LTIGDEHLEQIHQLPRIKALISCELGLSEDAVFECRLALTEAVANAFEHGRRDGVPYCRVRIQQESHVVRIAVEDHGSGFKWDGLRMQMPSPDQEHGRGVHLIRMLMDGVSILSSPDGTCVEMVKRKVETSGFPPLRRVSSA
jgi:anti-sigma regulatory factor (Ser/Thr protein kinase)